MRNPTRDFYAQLLRDYIQSGACHPLWLTVRQAEGILSFLEPRKLTPEQASMEDSVYVREPHKPFYEVAMVKKIDTVYTIYYFDGTSYDISEDHIDDYAFWTMPPYME